MTSKIPYVISEAHPDYKTPCLRQDFGTIEQDNIDGFFIEEVTEFILERQDIETINNVDDIESFWRYYYDEYYMDNPPWEARIFVHGEWKCVNPKNEVIFEHIQAIKNGGKNIKELKCDFDIVLNDETDKEFIWECTPEEEETQDKVREFLAKEILDEIDMESMLKMNQMEQIKFIFTKLASCQLSNEKYEQHRELLYEFTNLLLRCIEKDIKEITDKLNVIHDDKNAEKLSVLTSVYSNILSHKSNYFEV
jgi:hypothetical protein